MGKNIKVLAMAILAIGLCMGTAQAVNCPATQFASGINPLVCGTPVAGGTNTFRLAPAITASMGAPTNTNWSTYDIVLQPAAATLPAFVTAAAVSTNAAANTIVVTAPGAIVAGNILIAEVACQATSNALAATSIPAGWVLFGARQGRNNVSYANTFLYKIAVGGDVGAANYTFTFNDAQAPTCAAEMAQWSNEDQTNPIAETSWADDGYYGGFYAYVNPPAGAPKTNSLELAFFTSNANDVNALVGATTRVHPVVTNSAGMRWGDVGF
jgi:hypothetical protein